MKDIVAYAQKKFITIIPEIDMPAHCMAALAAYPMLLCSDSSGNTRPAYHFGDGTLCMREETFNFLYVILDELTEVFPSAYIHLGGDEAAKKNWKDCFYCNKRMKDLHLENYEQLQSYFVKRISKYLVSKGRKPIGWDEILQGSLAPNTTVMNWRGEKGGIEAVKQVHQAIMSQVLHSYFDFYLSADADDPVAWGGYTPLEKVYSYQPVPASLSDKEAALIIGGQANLWTEYVPDFQQAAYMIFPRLSSLSEVLWTNPAQKNYVNFVDHLPNIIERLKLEGVNYSPHRYEIRLKPVKQQGNYLFAVGGLPQPMPVNFTTDGTLPSVSSSLYIDSILVTNSSTIIAAVFDKDGNVTDKARVKFTRHKGLLASFQQLVCQKIGWHITFYGLLQVGK